MCVRIKNTTIQINEKMIQKHKQFGHLQGTESAKKKEKQIYVAA